MILRRVIAHVRKQEWTAIVIDFIIVVAGVFVGIQVSNWNAARAFSALERSHLTDLRAEIENDIAATAARSEYYREVFAAGERALAFLENSRPCTDGCRPVLVDFFHASQLINIGVAQTTFSEMRRVGLPRSRDLATAIGAYYSTNSTLNTNLNERPDYRNLVRGLIPVAAQQAMWSACHNARGGIEEFNSDCSPDVTVEEAARAVEAIRANPDIARTLTQWTASGAAIVKYLGVQNDEALQAIDAIDAELGTKP